MFRPGSLQRDYSLFSEYDEAFDLPQIPQVTDDSTDEDREASKAIAAERASKIRIARETGDWKPILRPGGKPVEFVCRQLPGTVLDWWHDYKAGEMARRTMLLRLSLKAIKNLDFPDDIVVFESEDGHRKLSTAALDYLYSFGTEDHPQLGRSVVGEIAIQVAERTFRGLVPLSRGG